MIALQWLALASLTVWLSFGLYLFSLARKTARLEERLSRMERTPSSRREP